ncbi:MAG: sporulation initiation factor Spo0A C-terminal domain-containing protein [Christensenellales bacterium]|jgi:two-component system response regulator (stage 0 sporulation protein A)
MRVVIAGADASLLKRLSAELEKTGEITVVGRAATGDAVLKYAQEYLPDAILADLILPVYDGLALTEILPSMGLEKVPRVFVMALPCQEKIARAAIDRGASGALQKPVDAKEAAKMLLSSASSVKMAGESFGWHISVTLNEIGIPRHLAGYRYLHDSIAMAVADKDIVASLTTTAYPYIAEKYSSSRSRVERSIRFAIESAWNRGRVDKIEEMFGYTVRSDVGRPTNREFIAMAAERVRIIEKDRKYA